MTIFTSCVLRAYEQQDVTCLSQSQYPQQVIGALAGFGQAQYVALADGLFGAHGHFVDTAPLGFLLGGVAQQDVDDLQHMGILFLGEPLDDPGLQCCGGRGTDALFKGKGSKQVLLNLRWVYILGTLRSRQLLRFVGSHR